MLKVSNLFKNYLLTLFIVFSQDYPDSEDFEVLLENLREELDLDLVNIHVQYAVPYHRFEHASEDYDLCDVKGLLCFMCTSYQPPNRQSMFDNVPRNEKVQMFAIVFTYRVTVGPGVLLPQEMGSAVPYQIEFGHWVSGLFR